MEETEDGKELLLQRHKKEKKELQSKIQGLKKTATKGDKKKKKEVQEEITKLELELTKKHEAELLEYEKEHKQDTVNEDVIKAVEELDINEKKPLKVSKAQKRRDKKAAEQKEREKYILEQEIENETGSRHIEMEKIKDILKKEGLMIYEIEADGNCLYNAVDHQLKMKTNSSYGANQLRTATSNIMKANVYDYLPFLSNSDTGEMMTEDEFLEYCDKVANSTNWGGQVELRALSHVVKRPIKVIQASGPILTMGEEYSDNESLTVCYHRHMYRLGEHYNSVQNYLADDENL
ncbi:UNVERIFIED_CONTAM: hypothetical protein PYX00_005645 [Menopon gallinae]